MTDPTSWLDPWDAAQLVEAGWAVYARLHPDLTLAQRRQRYIGFTAGWEAALVTAATLRDLLKGIDTASK